MTSFTTFLLNEWITLVCLINYRKGKMDVKLLQPISLKKNKYLSNQITSMVLFKNRKHIHFPPWK